LLALLPSALLLLAALAIFILQRLRPSVGYSWLIGSIAGLLSAGWVVYLRWRLPQQVAVEGWLPFSSFTDSPIFGLDGNTWPYLFCLAVVALAVMFTASARLEYNVNPYAWVGVLSINAVGMLAVLSANILTLILTWTLIDLLELIILQANNSERALNTQTVIGFAVRVTGTVLVMVAMLVSRGQNLPPTFSSLPPTSALLLLFAAGLRLGVLPLHQPNIQGIIPRRGLGTTLRMVAAASALVVLARLSGESVPQEWAGPMLAFTAAAALYSAVVWASAADEISGRPYWLITLGSLAVASVIEGQPRASLAWGSALILPGSLLFLYSARRRQVLFLPALGLLGLSGLPFTAAASGWSGIFNGPFSFWQFLLLAAHSVLLLGYLKFFIGPGDDLGKMQRWIQAMPGSFGPGSWWAGPTSLALATLIWLGATLWQRRIARQDALSRWYSSVIHNTGAFFTSLFNLAWLYDLLWWIYHRLLQIIQVVSEILEGEGGVLWTLVLLALLISLLQSRLAR
jgi:hypothetical protein